MDVVRGTELKLQNLERMGAAQLRLLEGEQPPTADISAGSEYRKPSTHGPRLTVRPKFPFRRKVVPTGIEPAFSEWPVSGENTGNRGGSRASGDSGVQRVRPRKARKRP